MTYTTSISNWYQPDIDRKLLRELTRKSDGQGLIRLLGFWGAQIVLAATAINYSHALTGWIAFFLYSLVYGFNESLRHECHHRTAFKNQTINAVVHWIAGFLCIKEAFSDRWLHTQHHTYTLNRKLDPEIMTERPPSFRSMFGQLSIFPIKLPMMLDMAKMACGIFSTTVQSVLPASERSKVIWSCRAMIGGYLLIFLLALVFSSWWPVILTFGARFVGGFLQMSFAHTQHVGLPDDVNDHRLNTRTIYLHPVLQFCYWNMNYHAEHHLYPSVPFHQLPALHELIKNQCPPAYKGMIAVWREIIPTLWRQKNEHRYSVVRPIPD